MAQVKAGMVDDEKKMLNEMSTKMAEQRESQIRDEAIDLANEMLKDFIKSPVFNGVNGVASALEKLADAIHHHARALESTAVVKPEYKSDFDTRYDIARENLAVTELERNLLTTEIPEGMALVDHWDLLRAWKGNRVQAFMETEEQVAAAAESVIETPEPVQEAPMKKRGRWNEELLFKRMDDYVNAGGDINKATEFKYFENGGYQWAIKHFKTDSNLPSVYGANWHAAVQAYINSK